MLPRKSERGYAESDNRNLEQSFLLREFSSLHFSLNLLKPLVNIFASFTSVLFLPRISPSPINVRFAYVCHLFTISGRECNQSGWKQMQPIRHDGQIRTDWGGQISIRSANAFNTDVDNRSCDVVVFSKCAVSMYDLSDRSGNINFIDLYTNARQIF